MNSRISADLLPFATTMLSCLKGWCWSGHFMGRGCSCRRPRPASTRVVVLDATSVASDCDKALAESLVPGPQHASPRFRSESASPAATGLRLLLRERYDEPHDLTT